MTNTLFTILSRKDSKGCSGKHTRLMGDKPLIAWTMEQAKRFGSGAIIVSSDDPEVHRLADEVCIPWVWQRPEPTDSTPKVPAIREALIDAESYHGHEFEIVVDLDATAPLRTGDDINGCIAALTPEMDCLLSVTVGVGRNPYFNLLEYDKKKKKLLRCKHIKISTRQEAPEVYEANSSIYVYRREFLLRTEVTSPLDGNCGVYVMPDVSYYHIDSELDWTIVESLMQRRAGV